MSPTTLYREGTDLDELLAELDSRYPSLVRVVEVTHPREGGVLGFFAKERVGVHYRLDDAAAASASDTAGSRSETVKYDDVRVAGSAERPRAGVARDGFGPDAAAIRAALAQRASTAEARFVSEPASEPAASAALPTGSPTPIAGVDFADDVLPRAAGEPVVTAVEPAAAPAAPAPGTAFAQILAEIAIRKATTVTSTDTSADSHTTRNTTRDPGRNTTRDPGRNAAAIAVAAPEPEAPLAHTAALPQPTASTRPAAAPENSAAAFAAARFIPLDSAIGLKAPAAATAATAAEPATNAATTPTTNSQRRRARAVPQFRATVNATSESPAAAGIEDDAESVIESGTLAPTVRPAFAALPQVSPLVSESASQPGNPADAAPVSAQQQPLADAVRPGSLSWPVAIGATCESDHPMSADGTRVNASAAIAVLARPADKAAETTVAASASLRDARYQLSGESGTGQSTPLTLRRQLLELGVPVDRVPTDAVHSYAAIETLVRGLSPAPNLPAEPGQLLVVAGCARDVVAAAESILVGNPGTFETTWTYGCSAALGSRRVSTTENVITSPRHAVDVAVAARKSTTGPTLIVVATDTTVHGTASDVAAAVGADSVWVAVDATRKPADTRHAMRTIGRTDAIVVANAEHSASPATVWELGLPIALVDGRPSTEPSWAVLLLGKLSELEESACSNALR